MLLRRFRVLERFRVRRLVGTERSETSGLAGSFARLGLIWIHDGGQDVEALRRLPWSPFPCLMLEILPRHAIGIDPLIPDRTPNNQDDFVGTDRRQRGLDLIPARPRS